MLDFIAGKIYKKGPLIHYAPVTWLIFLSSKYSIPCPILGLLCAFGFLCLEHALPSLQKGVGSASPPQISLLVHPI